MRRVAAGTPETTSLTPLRVAGFPTLAAAYSINELGNWLGDIALAVLVYDHTKSALATAALFVGTRFVPAFAAPPIVARIERARAGRGLVRVRRAPDGRIAHPAAGRAGRGRRARAHAGGTRLHPPP